MIEVLLGWIDSLKGLLLYIILYAAILLTLQYLSTRAYIRKLTSDDDEPPSANYMP